MEGSNDDDDRKRHGRAEPGESEDRSPRGKKRRRSSVSSASTESVSASLQERWESMFDKLKAYKERFGNCNVPNRYAEDPQLGFWVSTQRRQYRVLTSGGSTSSALTLQRAQKLINIGFEWSAKDPRMVPWELRYDELKAFVAKYGHAQVPIGWDENVPLSNWVSKQRQEFKAMQKGKPSRLTQARIDMLKSIGFLWEAKRGAPRQLMVGDASAAARSPQHSPQPVASGSGNDVEGSLSSHGLEGSQSAQGVSEAEVGATVETPERVSASASPARAKPSSMATLGEQHSQPYFAGGFQPFGDEGTYDMSPPVVRRHEGYLYQQQLPPPMSQPPQYPPPYEYSPHLGPPRYPYTPPLRSPAELHLQQGQYASAVSYQGAPPPFPPPDLSRWSMPPTGRITSFGANHPLSARLPASQPPLHQGAASTRDRAYPQHYQPSQRYPPYPPSYDQYGGRSYEQGRHYLPAAGSGSSEESPPNDLHQGGSLPQSGQQDSQDGQGHRWGGGHR